MELIVYQIIGMFQHIDYNILNESILKRIALTCLIH